MFGRFILLAPRSATLSTGGAALNRRASNPLPRKRNLAILVLALARPNIRILLHDGRDAFPDLLALVGAVMREEMVAHVYGEEERVLVVAASFEGPLFLCSEGAEHGGDEVGDLGGDFAVRAVAVVAIENGDEGQDY